MMNIWVSFVWIWLGQLIDSKINSNWLFVDLHVFVVLVFITNCMVLWFRISVLPFPCGCSVQSLLTEYSGELGFFV